MAAINAAEVLGKQMVGKKTEYTSSQLKGQTRKFGVITKDGDVDVPGFKKELAKYKGTVTSEATYPPTGGTVRGRDTRRADLSPTIVTKMKADGVTTMVLFTDTAMNKALMEQASKQEWFPEWFHTGNSYADYSTFAKTLPPEQAVHFFGISGSSPYLTPQADPEPGPRAPRGTLSTGSGGPRTTPRRPGSATASTGCCRASTLLVPTTTPKTFQQGQFFRSRKGRIGEQLALRGAGWVREDETGLPYDEYNRVPADYLLFWMAPDVEAANATGTVEKPSSWFVNNAQRYRAGTYPTKKAAVVRQGQVGRLVRHAAPAAEGTGPDHPAPDAPRRG